ncbi:hypothetical protein [Nonomuraea endophytica]|uniref:Uncharacterized protein n=1 Tax=Nonomuraea endophytica TaxID=714136 RepID=A0A7W8EDX5_9ACTN|nr:hypothetical protein [Nonomuraea endophytica]MBB5075833.1 hypothetical protein [Nonomuraea endophytica]
MTEGWTPRFPGQRPPFQPGHELSVRHGVYSLRKVDPVARELVAEVLADPECAYLGKPRWRGALEAWARAEAQVRLLMAYQEGLAEVSGDGVGDLADERVRAAYALLHRAENRAARERSRLGLDPLSAARLGRDVAAAGVDMAKLLSGLDHEGNDNDDKGVKHG